MTIFLPVVPPKATSQSAGKRMMFRPGARPLFFKNKAAEMAEATLEALMIPHRPPQPLHGPLRASFVFVWPWRSAEPKKTKALGRVPMTARPDLDNLSKMLGDALTRLRFIEDDSQIYELTLRKFWGDDVGITIELEATDGERAPT